MVGRHKAGGPRNTAIILRVQAYGKRMPNTVSQSKIIAENSGFRLGKIHMATLGHTLEQQ